MIYVLDKIAPGTANHDTLLYGAEVKFYSSKVAVGRAISRPPCPASTPSATARALLAAFPRRVHPVSTPPA